MRIEELFSTNLDKLTRTDISVLNFIISNKKMVVDMSLEEIAEKTYSSTASLVRCAKKLGFSGFSELKFFIKNEVDVQGTAIKTTASHLVGDIKETIKLVSQTNLFPICETLASAKRIFVFGTDWGERTAAEVLARNFMACKVFIHIIPSMTELNWLIDTMQSRDFVIIISFRGENAKIKKIINKLKIHDVSYMSITPLSQNILSTQADFNLYYKYTDLDNVDSEKEYNMFSVLNILVDMFYCYYHDNFYSSDEEIHLLNEKNDET